MYESFWTAAMCEKYFQLRSHSPYILIKNNINVWNTDMPKVQECGSLSDFFHMCIKRAIFLFYVTNYIENSLFTILYYDILIFNLMNKTMLLLLLLMDTPLLCTTFHVLDVSHPHIGSRKNM